jgi:uncharacterized protein (TIGR02145 family)
MTEKIKCLSLKSPLHPLLLASVLYLTAAWLLVSWCSKKPVRNTVPESSGTSAEIIMSETTDTLSVAYDMFTDKRDGKTYRTVKIGEHTWMAENLNYEPKTGNSRCYKDSSSYCKKFGRLYDWETARTVCPSGWHLPSREEWDSLARYVGGTKAYNSESGNHIWYDAGKHLKSKTGWTEYSGIENSDTYGFSAQPGGFYYVGSFNYAGDNGYWWTTTALGSAYAYNRGMYCYDDYVDESNDDVKNGFSVRCRRDAAGWDVE